MTLNPLDAPGTAAMDSTMAQSHQQEIKQLQKLAGGGSENLEEVAAKFESIFLNFLIKQMWQTVEKSDLLPESPGRELHEGMMTTMLADYLAEHGGMGIAKAMVTQLKTAADAYRTQQEQRAARQEGDEPKNVETSSSV
ncbi:MAG: rod-binding protein [Planctomycetes bacterium]|nr:rod-binding protein [Planctomycetota bacterium]